MIVINEPIGRFVAFANLEKDLLHHKSIEHDISNLVDLISIRSKDKSIEVVANSLLENIFNLRFELIEWLANREKDQNDYFTAINNYISVNLQLSPYSNLAETISTVLLAYENIVAPTFKNIPNTFNEIRENIRKNRPEYDTFKLLSLHPSPQIKYLKKWIDASLQLEVGIILSDLILTNQTQFPKKRIKSELITFLCDSITKFGAYSIFTGFWKPASDDISDLTNRMKILSATTELDNNLFYKTSQDGLFNLINN